MEGVFALYTIAQRLAVFSARATLQKSAYLIII